MRESPRLSSARQVQAHDQRAAVLPMDTELIRRIQQREEHALAMLYDRYARLLYSIALRITNDRMITEEVLQDVFQDVWGAACHFHPNGIVRVWLIGITRHRAIDATRGRLFRARGNEWPFADDAVIPTAVASDDPAIRQLQHRTVCQALNTLTHAERQVIVLAYYDGLTRRQIADVLGEPLGTIKSRLRIGLLKLRALLQELEE